MDGMDENDVRGLYELAGLTYPEDEKKPDEPTTADKGSKEQEPAEPVPPEVDPDDTTGADDAEGKDGDSDDDYNDEDRDDSDQQLDKQTPEENAKYQAARKKAEAKMKIIEEKAAEAIKAEKERADSVIQTEQQRTAQLQAEIDKFYAAQGLVNPYRHDAPIKTQADHEAFLLDEAREQIRQGNVLPEYVERIAAAANKAATAPKDVQPQQKPIDEVKLRADIKAELRRDMEIERRIQTDIEEIQKQDPDIKLTGDRKQDFEIIMQRPYGKAMQDNLKQGMTLINAFNVGAKDFLMEREKAKVEAATKAKEAGKSHLQTPNGRGTAKEYIIPTETKETYRYLFPEKSDKEIHDMYAKDQEKHHKTG